MAGSCCCSRDVDGVEYTDYMSGCGRPIVPQRVPFESTDHLLLVANRFGASVLGYNNPAVEAAAAAQNECGVTLTGPTARSVDLAERLVQLRPGAAWAILAKNGTDATLAARAAARAATGRAGILREAAPVEGHSGHTEYWAYHGAQQWLRGSEGVLPAESRSEVTFSFCAHYQRNTGLLSRDVTH
eukprot:SAG31_NODE_2280_length_6025_cov_8.850321_2_plen_186_part_00